MDPWAEISPEELKARLDAGAAPVLLDIREPWEHAICTLPGARLIPMEALQFRVDELDPEGLSASDPRAGVASRVSDADKSRIIVVYCHHGIRSAAVVPWLRAQGIPAVNLRGGIDAWTLAVDPTLPRY